MPPPPWPVKIGQKMAAARSSLYFMFLGLPSPKFLDPLLVDLNTNHEAIKAPENLYILIDIYIFPIILIFMSGH